MNSIQNLNEDSDSHDLDLDSNDSNEEIVFGFLQNDDYQLSLSSPSSLNSDDCVYAYRGRIEIMANNNPENQLNGAGILQNHEIHNQQNNEQDNEETDDFLEMDFDPETNSEIENDPQSDQGISNGNHPHHHIDLENGQREELNGWAASHLRRDEDQQKTAVKNTGTKPKILTSSKASSSRSRHCEPGDPSEKLPINNNYYNNPSTSNCCLAPQSSLTFNLSQNHNNHVNNNLEGFSNGASNNLLLNDNQFTNLTMENQLNNNHFKYHQSYSYLNETNHHHFCSDRLLLDLEVSTLF
jgi:hypothetical protein